MSWTDLLFLHWRADPNAIRRALPEGVELDTFDGDAWIGLVPFKMTDCGFAGFGWVPGLRNFYECNVRTYVRAGGLSGVWFFSLDAQHLLPVLGGRWMWDLNYVHSRFDVRHAHARHDYRLARRRGNWPAARSHVVWSVGEALPTSAPGSLEHFLTERYWLFTRKRSGICAGQIHHDTWPLRAATLEHLDDTLLNAAGFPGVSDRAPALALASQRIDVTGAPLRPLAAVATQ